MTMIQKNSTNVVRYFMMRLVADGTAATGLTITTFDLQYTRELTAAATKIDAIVGTGGATTHVDNKVFELDATSSPGLYMVCFPDAAFATGVDQVTLNLKYDATVFTEAQNIQLVTFNPFDVLETNVIEWLGTAAATPTTAGVPEVDVTHFGGTIQTTGKDVSNEVATILLDTNELQADWTNTGRLDTILDTIATDTTTDIPATITTLTNNVATVDTEVGLIQADLDDGTKGLTALRTVLDLIVADTGTDGVVISTATAQAIADELLKRDWDSVTGEAARSALNALRFLRNKWSISGGTLTVTQEDDTTSAWTATVTTDAAADPITGNDPA